MCIGLYYYVFLLSTLYLMIRANDEPPVRIFADVIKNISRINNMLEDLVNNYEREHKSKLKSNKHVDKLGQYTDTDIDEEYFKKKHKELNLEKKKLYESQGKEIAPLDNPSEQKNIARIYIPSSTPVKSYRDVIKPYTTSNEFIEPIKTEAKYHQYPSKTYADSRQYEAFEMKPGNSYDSYIGTKENINSPPMNTNYKPYKTHSREYIQPALVENKLSDVYSNKLKTRDDIATLPTVPKYNELFNVKTTERINPAIVETKYGYSQKINSNSRDYVKPPAKETDPYKSHMNEHNKKHEPYETRYKDLHKINTNSREYVKTTQFQTKYHDPYQSKTNLGEYTTHESIDLKFKLVNADSKEYKTNEHKRLKPRDTEIMPMKKRYQMDSKTPVTTQRYGEQKGKDRHHADSFSHGYTNENKVTYEKNNKMDPVESMSSILKYVQQMQSDQNTNVEEKKKENVHHIARQKLTTKAPAKSMINVRIYAKLDSNNTHKKVPIRKGKTEIRPKAFLRPSKIKEKETLSKETEMLLNKDLFKTNVLREAYGEACLRLVVAKCYIACNGASADFCGANKCTNIFKDTFKNNSRTECIAKFSNSIQLRRNENVQLPLDEKIDLAERSGYIALCMPMKDAKEKMDSMFPEDDKDGKGLTVLRNKYESACRNESIRQCTKACTCAYKNACSATTCPNINVKTIENKFCKKKCTSSFTFQPSNTKHRGDKDDTHSSTDDSKSISTAESDETGSDETENDTDDDSTE